MSVPIRPNDPAATNFYDGEHIGVWRNSARKAMARLRINPADPEAVAALRDAQEILHQHAGRTGVRMDAANAREAYSGAEAADATSAGGLQAFAANALDAASLGTGDEIAGLGALLPGGVTPQQARDRYRAGRGQLFEDHPIASTAGQITGAVGLGAAGTVSRIATVPRLAGQLLPRATVLGTETSALPFLSRTIAQGGTLRGSVPASAGAGALIGGAEGLARGLFGEGTIGERVEDAALQGAIGAGLGGAGTGLVNWRRVKRAEKLSARRTAANNEELSNIKLERERAMTPARVQSAQNAAALSSARVEQIPNNAARADAAVEAIPDNVEYRQIRNELMRFRRDHVRTLRSQPVAQRDVSPEGTETALRGWLQRQGMDPDAVERSVEAARRVPGSRLGRTAAPSPIPVSTAPVAAPAPIPEAPPSVAAEATHHLASTQAEAAALPGTLRPDAGLVRGRHGMQVGAQASSQIPEATRNFTALLRLQPAQRREVLKGLDADALQAVYAQAQNAKNYGWLTRSQMDELGTLLGPL